MEIFDYSAVKDLLKQKKKILITSHANPDGDAVGSSLALYLFLKAMGHDVYSMVPNNFPDFLSWLPGSKKMLVYDKEPEYCNSLMNSCDVLFSLDYNSPSRLGTAAEYFESSQATKILIDHHIDPQVAAYDILFSKTAISSTCELIYDFLAALNENLINQEMAEGIYVGIMTDTGSFSYNCNFSATFQIVSKLIEKGIDTNKINRLVYANNSESRLRLLGYSLAEKLTLIPEYHTAYISLTKDELNRFNHKKGDTEGLVNYALSIEGIRFAVLFTERESKIRLSLRSTGEFSVNDFARKHYKGGGHRNAAGGDSFLPMDQTISEFNRLLLTYSDELK